MRTTIDIGDELLRRAKQRATDDGIPLREVVETALREFLSGKAKKSGYKLQWTPDKGKILPGVDLDDRNSLWDVMDGLK
jgi:hypothetical protein